MNVSLTNSRVLRDDHVAEEHSSQSFRVFT